MFKKTQKPAEAAPSEEVNVLQYQTKYKKNQLIFMFLRFWGIKISKHYWLISTSDWEPTSRRFSFKVALFQTTVSYYIIIIILYKLYYY